MVDVSKWFESRSTDQDAARIRRHLDGVIGKLTGIAARRRDRYPPLDTVGTKPDPEQPDEPVNSL